MKADLYLEHAMAACLLHESLTTWLKQHIGDIIVLPVFASLLLTMGVTQRYIDTHPEVLEYGGRVYNAIAHFLVRHPDLVDKLQNFTK